MRLDQGASWFLHPARVFGSLPDSGGRWGGSSHRAATPRGFGWQGPLPRASSKTIRTNPSSALESAKVLDHPVVLHRTQTLKVYPIVLSIRRGLTQELNVARQRAGLGRDLVFPSGLFGWSQSAVRRVVSQDPPHPPKILGGTKPISSVESTNVMGKMAKNEAKRTQPSQTFAGRRRQSDFQNR